MTNKLKILMSVGLVAGQVLSGGSAALAEGGINSEPVPVRAEGPEIYLERIAPEEQKVWLKYFDRGGRNGLGFTNLQIVWPKDEGVLRAENTTLADDYEFNFDAMAEELTDTSAWWAITYYNGANANYLPASGWALEIPNEGAGVLMENRYNTLYFSLQLTRGLEQKYWIGKADYNYCMSLWRPGVECVAQIKDDSTVKYYPYLNGVLVEPEEDTRAEDDEGSGEDNNEKNNEEIDKGSSDEGEKGGGEEKNDEVASDVKMTDTEEEKRWEGEPVLLAGVSSAVIDSGNGNGSGNGNVGGNTVRGDAAYSDESDEEVAETEEQDVVAMETMEETTEDITEVPELGGGEGQNFWGLVLAVMAALAGVLMAWWWIILPLLKRKKEEDEEVITE